MNELNPTNAFGELLLDLIEAQYGDIDPGVEAVMQSTGLGEDEVIAIIKGDTIVDDENLLSAIVDAFPDADEDDLEVIVNVAEGVSQEDRDALIGQLEQDEMQSGTQEAPEQEAAEYSANVNNQANFSAMNTNTRVAELENKLANFEYASAITNRLKELDNIASAAVLNEQLPPSYKSMLLGDFSNDSQRVARFSQIAQSNGVDLETMLFSTEYALGLLTEASNFIEFKDYSITQEDVAMANFSANLDEVVKQDIDAIFGN